MMENYDEQYNKHHQHASVICRFSVDHGVQCDTVTCCEKCGWNPKVEKARKAKIRAARTKPKGKKTVHFYLGSGSLEKVLPKKAHKDT